jgi:hypothetical protein
MSGVMIGMPIFRHIETETTLCLLHTLALCRREGVQAHHGYTVGVSVIAVARNRIAALFLDSDAEHLFWIDADVVWEAPDFLRLLKLAGRHPIICAAYPTKTEPPRFQIQAETLLPDKEGLLTILSMGLGFTCVQRRVIETLAKQARLITADDGSKIRRVFHGGVGADLGEDKNFYADAMNAGFPVKLVPDVALGHVGTKVYRGKLSEVMKR